MSYTKQNWQTGDIITADKLNHMEDGISGGVLVVHVRMDYTKGGEPTYTVDVPYADVVSVIETNPVLYHYKRYVNGEFEGLEYAFGIPSGNAIEIQLSPTLYHTVNGITETNTSGGGIS